MTAGREMLIREDDLQGPEIATLLEVHLAFSDQNSPFDSCHALGLDDLRSPDTAVWTVWVDGNLLGCGALKALDPRHGEIKSMHTAEAHRGKGVGALVVKHLMDEARGRSYQRLSLETGVTDAFAPARALYARFGFVPCPPFGSYVEHPFSVFMTRTL